MDLRLYSRVLWRFRVLVAVGILFAVLLAGLSMVRISPSGIKYRQHEIWQSQATLFITQKGFPWGALNPNGDPGRFSGLADLYAQFASSDAVKAQLKHQGLPKGSAISASTIPASNPGGLLPLIGLFGTAYTPSGAVKAVERGTSAFLTFLNKRQEEAGISPNGRIRVSVLQKASSPIPIQPRKKTLPIIVFLAALSATIALAFILENVRPQIRIVPAAASQTASAAETRRSA